MSRSLSETPMTVFFLSHLASMCEGKSVSDSVMRIKSQRRSMLLPRGDGPFQVIDRINDNAYKLGLPSECGPT